MPSDTIDGAAVCSDLAFRSPGASGVIRSQQRSMRHFALDKDEIWVFGGLEEIFQTVGKPEFRPVSSFGFVGLVNAGCSASEELPGSCPSPDRPVEGSVPVETKVPDLATLRIRSEPDGLGREVD